LKKREKKSNKEKDVISMDKKTVLIVSSE